MARVSTERVTSSFKALRTLPDTQEALDNWMLLFYHFAQIVFTIPLIKDKGPWQSQSPGIFCTLSYLTNNRVCWGKWEEGSSPLSICRISGSAWKLNLKSLEPKESQVPLKSYFSFLMLALSEVSLGWIPPPTPVTEARVHLVSTNSRPSALDIHGGLFPEPLWMQNRDPQVAYINGIVSAFNLCTLYHIL